VVEERLKVVLKKTEEKSGGRLASLLIISLTRDEWFNVEGSYRIVALSSAYSGTVSGTVQPPYLRYRSPVPVDEKPRRSTESFAEYIFQAALLRRVCRVRAGLRRSAKRTFSKIADVRVGPTCAALGLLSTSPIIHKAPISCFSARWLVAPALTDPACLTWLAVST